MLSVARRVTPPAALLVVAAGHAAWLPMVLVRFGAGDRLLVEAATLAGLGVAAWALARPRPAAPWMAAWGLAIVAGARGGWFLASPGAGLRGVADGLLLAGLALAVLALAVRLTPRALVLAGAAAAVGTALWFPIQAADQHWGWSPGTWLQAAGWALLSVAYSRVRRLSRTREGEGPERPKALDKGGRDTPTT